MLEQPYNPDLFDMEFFEKQEERMFSSKQIWVECANKVREHCGSGKKAI